ncbi:MAG: DNA repair protein RecN, partial [Acetobacteraceae bacterium]
AEAIAAALSELAPRERRAPAPAASVRAAARALGRLSAAPSGKAGDALAALERAEEALTEALSLLEECAAGISGDPGHLERAEARLFALRAAARKYHATVGELPEVTARLAGEQAAIEDRTALVALRAREMAACRILYAEAAERLGEARRAAARGLEERLAEELPPLKLEKARFECRVASLAEVAWGPHGKDAVAFLLAANPGQEPAPLARAASGGELARLMLALKVVLAGTRNPATLIFDEIDAGISGAAAAAVGERLARIARETQVLVVTHSPQVAVHGDAHVRITKGTAKGRSATRAAMLGTAERQEEIARMLAGARVTDAARAAAESLLTAPGAIQGAVQGSVRRPGTRRRSARP